ncbi:GNAT family N-acetyltransferase [Streptomyces sp.]|uniref:GNAT family N-acetyltransferase n=1 Tax=Streptomyces sp. TaxID=1931 RepID=UPI003456CE41
MSHPSCHVGTHAPCIGPDTGCPPVTLQGQPVHEAKILAFGVPEQWRRRGVGTALQQAVISAAATKGCHQVRSHSSVAGRLSGAPPPAGGKRDHRSIRAAVHHRDRGRRPGTSRLDGGCTSGGRRCRPGIWRNGARNGRAPRPE